MNCKNCGALMKPGTFFCANCGTENYPMSEEATVLFSDNQQTVIDSYTDSQTVITNPVQWNTPQPQPQPPEKKANTGLIVAIVVMAVIIIAGIAAIIGYSAGHNDDTAVTKQPETTTESATQSVEAVVQQETTTAAPETEAARTTAAPTVNQQTVPTFTYNDNNTQSSQFLFDSANQYITKSYLSTCTRDEITIILNEMYARHGYIFKDAELREYFNSQSWYVGYTTSMEEAASYFNKIETANLNTIYEYMKDMGWRQ